MFIPKDFLASFGKNTIFASSPRKQKAEHACSAQILALIAPKVIMDRFLPVSRKKSGTYCTRVECAAFVGIGVSPGFIIPKACINVAVRLAASRKWN